MPKLTAIVIAVVAIVAIVLYFARSPSDTSTPAAAAPERQPSQAPKHEGTVELTETRAQSPGQPLSPKQDPRPSPARKNSPPAAPQLTAEQQQQAACIALSDRRLAREKAALDAEPKDAAWAYPMEQKLREHLTQKLQSGGLEVIGIDCHTTFCEIKALLLDPEASTEFNKAISDISGKSWNDFTGSGTSLSEEAGKTFYFGHLRRPQFKEESHQTPEEAQAQAACTARSIEKQKRERAARDAQTKDPTWAEPMEQMLRQYLTTQVRKHPVESIDIDCRTTFCQIKANGRTNDASLALQKAVMAAAEEPWAELRMGEGGSSGYGDSWKQHYVLYRR